jgi:phosphatidylserine/phosphatidylglycerophosphate/cardiolipin synthase-like enzyme
LLEALPIRRHLRVKPLLTPDRQGNVFTDAVIDLIGSARRQLVLQNQYIKISPSTCGNLAGLVDALVEKSNEIDDVRIVLRGGDSFDANIQEPQRRGMRVVNDRIRRLSSSHTKGIVVDGERVLIGSHNWSSDAVSANRDASLIFDDEEIAKYFLRAFEIDWRRATRLGEFAVPAADETPRPALGPRPPPGFVRMRLADYLEG